MAIGRQVKLVGAHELSVQFRDGGPCLAVQLSPRARVSRVDWFVHSIEQCCGERSSIDADSNGTGRRLSERQCDLSEITSGWIEFPAARMGHVDRCRQAYTCETRNRQPGDSEPQRASSRHRARCYTQGDLW